MRRTAASASQRETRARYPIRAVSKLTGISIDTLRAWERRHAAVAPVRDDRGRLYTDADVDRLRLLHRALTHGHSIGRLAPLTNEELQHLASEPAASGGVRARPDSGGTPSIPPRSPPRSEVTTHQRSIGKWPGLRRSSVRSSCSATH